MTCNQLNNEKNLKGMQETQPHSFMHMNNLAQENDFLKEIF